MLLLFLLLFLGLCFFLFVQYQKYCKANKLYSQAKILEQKDTNDPNNSDKLKEALAVYKQCERLVKNSTYTKAISRCQKKIDDRLRFQSLVNIGKNRARENYFREALHNLNKAEHLFSTREIKEEINKCYQGIERENKYEQVLEKSNQIAREGGFKAAIDLLIPAVDNFPRQDGEKLLDKLKLAIKTKKLYQLGLIAEHNGQIKDAIANYQQVLELVPEYIDCKLRLAIIAIKDNPQQAIDYVKKIDSKQAAYIRGFAYTQLENWQQADREWGFISCPSTEIQRKNLKHIIECDRLKVIHEIEQLVDKKQIEIAKSVSINFINKHDDNLIVKNNLDNYINPVLEYRIWQNENWEEIANNTKQNWLEKQDIKSLHNWAVATYYQAQANSNKLEDFITAWSTTLANIKLNPIFKDIPWLGSNSVDLQDVSNKLKQLLENAIDEVKDDNIEEYLKLRDIYRRDMLMLSLSQKDNWGVKTQSKLLILPNYYQHFKKHLPHIELPTEIWGALYTDWGMAVAACQVGDVARAVKIKPKKKPLSEVEYYARTFISYHEGCHYLQNQSWRKAIKYLQAIKSEIRIKLNWSNEIDRLCEIQRQQIGEFEQHLEFSKLWYFLIESKASKGYYVEYQSMKVGLDVDNQKISYQQAINKLKELQNIDPDNSVNFNIIKTLSINLELEKINHLWQQSKYKEAVQVARQSLHEKVRFAVAEVCLEIVLEILQSGNLTTESIKSLQQITEWAYELCPREPLFQATYSQLRQLGIYR